MELINFYNIRVIWRQRGIFKQYLIPGMEQTTETVTPVTRYKRILFFNRIVFICNVFFWACVLVRFTSFLPGEYIPSFVIILGWVLSFFLNLVAIAIKLVLFLKDGRIHLPVWMSVFNFLTFGAQIFIYFILPG